MGGGSKTKPRTRSYLDAFESQRTFKTWQKWFWVFLALTLLATPLFVGGDLKTNNKIFTAAFFALQLGIFVVAGVKSFYEAKAIERERQLAKVQVEDLQRVDIDNISDFLKKASKMQGVFFEHIQHLHAISTKHHQINQDGLIEVMQARLQARNRTVEVWAGILVTVGLLGTIVGLVFMLDSMAVIMQGGPRTDLIKELFATGSGPMAGLGFAFYTTLIGAYFGGVWLRVQTSIVDEGITDLCANVAELTEVYVLPLLRREAEAAARQSVA
jgi:MotA/TolQ/ExbB proton channel family